jgi:hypothetical protein
VTIAAERARPSLVEIIAALATNEQVREALQAYDGRDRAVELLEEDIELSRRQLVDELRTRAARPAAAGEYLPRAYVDDRGRPLRIGPDYRR